MKETLADFLKEKFYFITVTLVLIIVFSVWVYYTFEPQVKEFLIAVFGAWLALLGVRPKVGTQIQTDTVTADNIDTATTQSGDIVTTPTTHTTKDNQGE